MSRDRVKFFLAPRYFNGVNNGMTRKRCVTILRRSFGMSADESVALMDRYSNGFWIVCRPSQFARFIVYRHIQGYCVNGVKDLQPKLVPAEQLDLYQDVADATGVDRCDVKRVALALNCAGSRHLTGRALDVSDRQHRTQEYMR